MIYFGDSAYYINLKAFDKAITLTLDKSEYVTETEETITLDGANNVIQKEIISKTIPRGKEIDAAKYSLLNTCIEYILDNEDVQDDTLGAERALSQTSLGYKIAFNTLLNEGIIKEK